MTNHPLTHSLPSDIISPNLSSDSTYIPTDSPRTDLNAGIGAKRNRNEVGKRRTRGKCLSTQVALDLHSLSAGESHRHSTTIDILPDDILLEIFVSILSGRTPFIHDHPIRDHPIWGWHKLVHVCRRWRQLIFASPLRLDLQLLCTRRTSIRKDLGCWPAFPLVIDYLYYRDARRPTLENLFAALEQRDRVRHINIIALGPILGELFAVMEKPFPALTHPCFSCEDHSEPAIPNAFLGGSTPLLRDISFSGILFRSIPTFLSSASDLVKLRLDSIPHTSFPSPEAMVACLATLTKLETIFIRFQEPTTGPYPSQIGLLPETCVILPSLTSFSFKRDNAYSEDFVARINAPRLNSIDITYTEDDLRATELSRFIERSNLRPTRLGHATIYFEFGKTFFFYPETNPDDTVITIEIESLEEDVLHEQVVDMTRVLRQASVLLSDVVHLEIESDCSREIGEDDVTDNTWRLELFHPFIAVETLRISYQFVEGVAHAFEKMPVEMATQVLPALKSLHLEGPFTTSTMLEGLSSTFRQACGRPLIITSDDRF
jgi:hypothetical protein